MGLGLILLGMLAFPGAAGASTVSVAGPVLTYDGTGTEDNAVVVTQTSAITFEVTDAPTVAIVPGSGCLGSGAPGSAVTCTALGLTSVVANGSAGADSITTTALPAGIGSTLNGGDANDTLAGGAGSDRLDGGAGLDTVSFAGLPGPVYANLQNQNVNATGQGNDRLTTVESLIGTPQGDALGGTNEANALFGMGGDDSLFGNDGADLVLGGEGSDALVDFGGSDILDGGSGNDRAVWGGEGNDSVQGGDGDDQGVDGGPGVDLVDGGAGADTVSGGDGSDTGVGGVLGGPGDDSLSGDDTATPASGGDDRLEGGDGSDSLRGQWRNDVLIGGLGSDTAVLYAAGPGPPVLVATLGAPGSATSFGGDPTRANGDDTIAADVENLSAVGCGCSASLTGDDQANVLTGGDGNDTIRGLGGDDRLPNTGGVNKLDGGAGGDTLGGAFSFGEDTVDYQARVTPVVAGPGGGANDGADIDGDGVADEGDDIQPGVLNILGGSGDDTLSGSSLRNTLAGNSGNDDIAAGPGVDILTGGAGVDVLDGGADQDITTYEGAAGAVIASLESGQAPQDGDGGTDTLISITDLTGGPGADRLTGKAGELNVLSGLAGADTIEIADGGPDTAACGLGNDNVAADEAAVDSVNSDCERVDIAGEPDTQIDSGAPATSPNSLPTFTFSSPDEPTSRFECRFDLAGFAPCSGPGGSHSLSVLNRLSDGQHTFYVRAVDAGGLADPDPASRTFTVDTASPITTITGGPSGPTNNPAFTFTANEAATFECRFDGETFGPCAGPTSHVPGPFGLSDGGHTFAVRARDSVGNLGAPVSRSFTLDRQAPQITDVTGPSGPTNDSTPTFTFPRETGGSYECSFDFVPLAPCSDQVGGSHTPASPLDDGPHTFHVRPTDPAGNTGPTFVEQFSVDTVSPVLTITDGPSGSTMDPTPSFIFTAAESANFKCAFDGTALGPCSGPGNTHTPILGLSEGQHTFRLHATDQAGNVAETTRAFQVDTVGPQLTIHGPPATTTSTDATVVFSASEPATFECRLDQGNLASCTSPTAYTGLQVGEHTFQLKATDSVGNATTSAPYTWTVLVPPQPPAVPQESGAGDTAGVTGKCKPKKRKGKKRKGKKRKKCGGKRKKKR